MKKAVVLLSGGIDSTTALAMAIKKYGKENVSSIAFNYGQRNINELKSSKKIAKYYGVDNRIINIKDIFSFSDSALLNHSKKLPPHTTYEEQVETNKEIKTDMNVPFRNGLFLSIACSYALSNNIDVIVYGAHLEVGVVHELYPDCSQEFNKNINKAIYAGSGKKVKIWAPLINITKNDIIGKAIKLKIPFTLTWTCYESNKYACGKCNSCRDRIAGFKINNSEDPIKYM